jgi:MFS family permease
MERKWLILTSVSLGSLMATLDGSIVNIALPAIQTDFRIDLTTVEWVVVAYLLVVGSLLLPFGRLGEVLTFKRVYLVGFAIFTLASVCCGARRTPRALVAFRVVQGSARRCSWPWARRSWPTRSTTNERGRPWASTASASRSASAWGPALGGILTQVATWRAIFLINAPIGLLAISGRPASSRPKSRQGPVVRCQGSRAFRRRPVRPAAGTERRPGWGWTSPAIVGLLIAFVVLGAAFLSPSAARSSR